MALYAVLVLVCLALIILPDAQQRVMASYVEDFALGPLRRVELGWGRMLALRRTNRRLSAEVEALTLELRRTEETRRENKRLREMLDLSRRVDLRLVGCEIIGEGGGRLGGRTLLLNRGARHGLDQDMPITGRDGVAGKIVEVEPDAARAILLNHRQSAVSVRVARSRQTGIVEWNPYDPSTLKLRGMAYLADVAEGDTLVTSGLGRVFPKGLTVGRVIRMARDPNGLLLDITVQPAVDFSRLEEVFALVEGRGPQGAEAAAPATAAAAASGGGSRGARAGGETPPGVVELR